MLVSRRLIFGGAYIRDFTVSVRKSVCCGYDQSMKVPKIVTEDFPSHSSEKESFFPLKKIMINSVLSLWQLNSSWVIGLARPSPNIS